MWSELMAERVLEVESTATSHRRERLRLQQFSAVTKASPAPNVIASAVLIDRGASRPVAVIGATALRRANLVVATPLRRFEASNSELA
jgi:hypothetical protein